MAEYISSFTTGFSEAVPGMLSRLLPGAKVLRVYDGLVNYVYGGRESRVEGVFIFNNSFQVIRKYQGAACDMGRMVRDAIASADIPATARGTFRVRYSVNNQFVGVDRQFTLRLEEKIARQTKNRVDRVSPQTEYWFIQRSERVGFFCRLLGKRKATEKTLHKGELRPELAYIMCALGGVRREGTALDPFAGYGAIPEQLLRRFSCARILASDNDAERVADLRRRFEGETSVAVARRDALDMADLPDASVDSIITDPPWGFYENIEDIGAFYRRMLSAFHRVLRPGGSLVLLSARKEEFEGAVQDAPFAIEKRYDTLVNGKKAAVYLLKGERAR